MNVNHLRNWLSNCPYITAPVTLEYLEAAPGAVALFSEGTKELSRRQDVVGNVWVTYRSSFSLFRRVPRSTDGLSYAQWLQDLQEWLRQKSIDREISMSYITRVQADAPNGHLQEDTADGMAVYKVSLDVEFVKTYLAK